ncbi:MAG: glycosyltransferase family 4 protein [Bacteroidetes bacterium]|nr:glycosyltransferase family 4 protein [Bacteroidota bacterium]
MSSNSAKRIVGTHSITYSQIRLFATLPFENYEVVKLKDFMRVPAHLYWKLKKKPHRFLTNLFYDAGLNKYDLLHFLNAVNMGNQPWICTFERYIPRDAHHPGVYKDENRYINYALQRAAHPSCKKLLALSNYAKRSQIRYLQEYGKYEEEIMSKVEVLHAPQKLMIHNFDEKTTNPDFLTFTITGADFFRKGGLEIIRVFDRLLSEKHPVWLNIISSLNYGDYASKSTKINKDYVLGIIAKHKQINHYTSLPNDKVLQLLRSTDIGLLPTYDDTYAFYVLECQAFGCPVITTNGAALPENNNNTVGWMIDVPLYEDGRSIPRGAEQKSTFSNIVQEKLYMYVLDALKNPTQIREKGEKAMLRIKNEHDLTSYTKRMEEIYNLALA